MSDVIVVGGGVIGLSVAYELAGQGAAVTVLDQSEFGKEASWAGAGILPPGNLTGADSPEAGLRALSSEQWPEWSARLLSETGIDNGYRNCGGIAVYREEHMELGRSHANEWRQEGVRVEELGSLQMRQYEPALHSDLPFGFRLPDLCQVRNPRHLKALIAGCLELGVQLRPNEGVLDIDVCEGKPHSVKTATENHEADHVVVASGAWTGRLVSSLCSEVRIKPMRGQIVMLSAQPLPIRHVIEDGRRYLVPRPDGRILIGSTEESVGFEKRNTAGAVGELVSFAQRLVPALRHAQFERAWCGLRPYSPDENPYIGPVPNADRMWIAAGHFRAGLQLSPATAVLVRELIMRQGCTIAVEAFGCQRPAVEAAPVQ